LLFSAETKKARRDNSVEMRVEKKRISCYYCGKKVELAPGEAPCEMLKGWLTLSSWKGAGDVDHYNFCSFTCLKSWIDAQAPEIPEIFLESFKEDKRE